MITIIHGQNVVASRELLVNLLEKSRLDGKVIIRLQKNDQTVEKLSQILGSEDLFGSQNIVLLENFLKVKPSKNDAFQQSLQKTNAEIFLWEDDQRQPAALSLFPASKILEFKVPSLVFKFLDALRPGNPKFLLETYTLVKAGATPEITFSLLVKRFIDLLSPSSKLASWQVARLRTQARLFSRKKLEMSVADLLSIDLAQKTSSQPISLNGAIELFLNRL